MCNNNNNNNHPSKSRREAIPVFRGVVVGLAKANYCRTPPRPHRYYTNVFRNPSRPRRYYTNFFATPRDLIVTTQTFFATPRDLIVTTQFVLLSTTYYCLRSPWSRLLDRWYENTRREEMPKFQQLRDSDEGITYTQGTRHRGQIS